MNQRRVELPPATHAGRCDFYQNQFLRREERIRSLEIENAALHLKLAQDREKMKKARTETEYWRMKTQYWKSCRADTIEGLRRILLLEVEALKKESRELLLFSSKWRESFVLAVTRVRADLLALTSARLSSAKKELVSFDELNMRLISVVSQLEESQRRLLREKSRRRDLHNALIELRGNIRVHCRVRPLLAAIDSANDESTLGKVGTPSEQIAFQQDDETLVVNMVPPGGSQAVHRPFEFDRVYSCEDSQETVFEDVAPLLTSLLDGYNVCIMAYGQTGSGKTHSMLGSHSIDSDLDESSLADEGLVPRAARELFRLMQEREAPGESYTLEISISEIYNNDIIDLLAPKDKQGTKLAVFSGNDGQQEIPQLTTRSVSSLAEVISLVYYGLEQRHQDATRVHAHSSRSHLIVQLNLLRTLVETSRSAAPSEPSVDLVSTSPTSTHRLISQLSTDGFTGRSARTNDLPVRSRSPAMPRTGRSSTPSVEASTSISTCTSPTTAVVSDPPKQASVVKTKLQLVDLAGSECVAMSGTTGTTFRETSNINKSLSALADVLQALSDHRSHIPYRNSRLTHMLQDTIGGDSKLLLMLCVSPCQRYSAETMQCVGFGCRARQVARGPAKKRRPLIIVSSESTPAKTASPIQTRSRIAVLKQRSTGVSDMS